MSDLIRNFADDFRHQVRQTPDATVFIDQKTEREWSWADMDALTARVAGEFAAIGLAPGETVLSLLPNSIEALGLYLACIRFGYHFAPLPPQSTEREIARLAATVKPRLCFTLPPASAGVSAVAKKTGLAVREASVDGAMSWLGESLATAPTGEAPRDSLLYMATSGSTGEPKGMVLDNNLLWSSGKAFLGLHGFVDADCRFYNILPVSYLGGLFNLALIPMAAGASTVVAEPFSGTALIRFWHDVARFDINVLWFVPTMARALLKLASGKARKRAPVEPGAVRAAFLGTAPIDLPTKLAFEEQMGFPVLENFGLSETTFISSETLDNRVRRGDRSVGTLLPYVDVKLAELAKNDGTHEARAIQVKTPFLFRGYIGADGITDLPLTEDGYFDTGDLGHVSNDMLVIDGRARDIIKKGGLLISLPEIESVATQAPDVAEAVAVDVAHDFYGEDYVLFVRSESPRDDESVVEAMRAWLTDNLVQSKWPTRIVPVSDLPRTASGKIIKGELRKMYTPA